jgi:hypothetical protein
MWPRNNFAEISRKFLEETPLNVPVCMTVAFQPPTPLTHTLLDIAMLLADLHIMRHMPPGLVREHEKKQPPQILHTWGRNLGE